MESVNSILYPIVEHDEHNNDCVDEEDITVENAHEDANEDANEEGVTVEDANEDTNTHIEENTIENIAANNEIAALDELLETYPEKSTLSDADVARKLREKIGTNATLLTQIMRIFKFAFRAPPPHKILANLTEQDLAAEIHATKLSLPNFDGKFSDILYAEQSAKLLSEQLAAVPVILDFTYMYAVGCVVPEAPLYKLPEHILKFCMISEQLQRHVKTAAQMTKYMAVHKAFIEILKDPIMIEFRQEDPPLIVQTTRAVDELRALLYGEVREKIKSLLSAVAMMGWETNKAAKPSNTPELSTADSIPSTSDSVPSESETTKTSETNDTNEEPSTGDSVPSTGDSVPSTGDSVPSTGDSVPAES